VFELEKKVNDEKVYNAFNFLNYKVLNLTFIQTHTYFFLIFNNLVK
jgi:hypothetical protein